MQILTGENGKEATGWIEEAAKVAEKALCLNAKCGVVIVKEGKIIGQGYNAPPLDQAINRMCDKKRDPGKPKYDQTCCVHAEWRALIDALKNNPDKLEGSTLYFTRVGEDVVDWGKPFCTVCSRIILDSGITKVVLPQKEGLCLYNATEYNQVSYSYTPE
jgi:deoxycytidylate deaminase